MDALAEQEELAAEAARNAGAGVCSAWSGVSLRRAENSAPESRGLLGFSRTLAHILSQHHGDTAS